MRIVQLITQSRGGPVDHAVSLARDLAALGHESHLVGPLDRADPALRQVTVHPLLIDSKFDVRGAVRLRRLMRTVRPDVVHCQDRRAGLVGRTAIAGAGYGIVYTLHGVPDSLATRVPGNLQVAAPSRSDRWQNLTGERLLARVRGTRVVVPCHALADYAAAHAGIPQERITVVHNGIDETWLSDVRRDDATASRPTRVVWVGVMQPVKRVPQLIRAITHVPDSRLTLVGDGPQREAIEAEIRHCGLQANVDLVGFQSDPRRFFEDADVMVLPSGAEACPMVVLQAMATGAVVVASRVGGIPEVVRDGIDGLLVDPADESTLVDALRRVGKDPMLRAELRSSARTRVAEHFTSHQTALKLLEVYAAARAEAQA